MREQINKVRAKALPLNVWVAKGYEEAAVKKFPSEDCPNLGKLYSVPVKETTLKEMRRLVEQEIQQKELAAKAKSSGKRKNVDVGNEEDEKDWDVVPHTSASMPAKGSGKAAKGSAATSKKAEQNLEKERAKQEKKNTEVSSLAARAAAMLAKSLKSLTSLIQQAEKVNHAAESVAAAKGALERGNVWSEKAGNLLGVAAAIKGSGAKLPELTFTGAELADYHKATTEIMKTLRSELKVLREEKQQLEKAAKDAEDNAKVEK